MSEWEERRCGDERGVGQAVAAIMHTCGGGARVVAEVGGAAPRVAWLGRVCFKQPVVRARAGAAPRAEFQPEFQLEDAKRGVPGRRVRVWAIVCAGSAGIGGAMGKGGRGPHQNARKETTFGGAQRMILGRQTVCKVKLGQKTVFPRRENL